MWLSLGYVIRVFTITSPLLGRLWPRFLLPFLQGKHSWNLMCRTLCKVSCLGCMREGSQPQPTHTPKLSVPITPLRPLWTHVSLQDSDGVHAAARAADRWARWWTPRNPHTLFGSAHVTRTDRFENWQAKPSLTWSSSFCIQFGYWSENEEGKIRCIGHLFFLLFILKCLLILKTNIRGLDNFGQMWKERSEELVCNFPDHYTPHAL